MRPTVNKSRPVATGRLRVAWVISRPGLGGLGGGGTGAFGVFGGADIGGRPGLGGLGGGGTGEGFCPPGGGFGPGDLGIVPGAVMPGITGAFAGTNRICVAALAPGGATN